MRGARGGGKLGCGRQFRLGDMAERDGSLERLKARQEALGVAIHNLPVDAVTADSRARLLKLVRAEGKFVDRLASHQLAASSPRLSSTNFAHLEAVVQILQHPLVTGASGVLQSFCAYGTNESAAVFKSGNYVTAHVDVVCSFDGKPVWVVTSTRNPKYIRWWADGNKKGLRSRLLSLLMAACEDVVVQPAFILLCFAGKLEQVVDRKLQSEFAALKVGSCSVQGSTDSAHLGSQQPPVHVDCSLDDDEDDDWVEITAGDDNIHGTGERTEVSRQGEAKEADTSIQQPPPDPAPASSWTTYLVRVSRVKLAELLAMDYTNLDTPSPITEEAMQLDKHVCSSDYTGREGKAEQDFVHTEMTAAPVVWSEEENSHTQHLVFSSLAQSLSQLRVSMRKLGRQPSTQSDLTGKSLVNLDTTALIALVSHLSNGGAFLFSQMDPSDLQKRFGNMWSFIRDQAKSELENPLVPEMEAVLATRLPVVSQFAVDEFKSIVSVIGGPQEKQRATSWLTRLRVLANMPSVRVMALDETGKVKERHKIVFGTGDFWHAPTLTANVSFVRAARNTGMALAAIEHRPRALTGD